MVRLLQFDCPTVALENALFQSHNGAIAARDCSPNCSSPNHWFQSHNGAIAAEKVEEIVGKKVVFQSHNGAIAARPHCRTLLLKKLVSIPQWCDCCSERRARKVAQKLRFNPTMVRLLPFSSSGGSDCKTSFQSHNGAIAARESPRWC